MVELDAVPVDPLCELHIAKRIKMHGEDKAEKTYPRYEWQRLSYVLNMLEPGARCLEVGPGRGYLSHMMATRGLYQEQIAADIVPGGDLSKFGPGVEFRQISIDELDYPENHFDAVICMEVLEHLEDGLFERGLDNIRRLCGGKLYMSVPYLEPLPLPSYHKQQFDTARVQKMFPDADYTLLVKRPVTRVPWMLMTENHA